MLPVLDVALSLVCGYMRERDIGRLGLGQGINVALCGRWLLPVLDVAWSLACWLCVSVTFAVWGLGITSATRYVVIDCCRSLTWLCRSHVVTYVSVAFAVLDDAGPRRGLVARMWVYA